MIPQYIYLVSLALSATGAPYPRERFVVFPLVGGAMALVGGLNPLGALLGIVALYIHRQSEARFDPRRDAPRSETGWR